MGGVWGAQAGEGQDSCPQFTRSRGLVPAWLASWVSLREEDSVGEGTGRVLLLSRTLHGADAGGEPPGPLLPTPRGSLAAGAPCPPPASPATLATRRASWFLGGLERFWLRCLAPVERALRRWTSVALKKATMKGCLFWGPCRPMRPANLGLTLCPRREQQASLRGGGSGHSCGEGDREHGRAPTEAHGRLGEQRTGSQRRGPGEGRPGRAGAGWH